jgi:hypothetical protein
MFSLNLHIFTLGKVRRLDQSRFVQIYSDLSNLTKINKIVGTNLFRFILKLKINEFLRV